MNRAVISLSYLTVFAAAALAPVGSAQAARLALVVGNGAYAQPQPALPHALNDSRDMAAVLRKAGFDVMEIENGAHATMLSGLAAFVAKLKPGDSALFYYAGHGVQAPTRAGKSITDDYLLPVDIKLQSPDSVSEQGVPLTEMLEAFGKVKSGPVLIILDACRNDPVAGSAGLAWPSSTAARNAFIVFAASPGETAGDPPNGEHGLFTGELLKRIGTPGLSAAALFTEVANAVEQASDPTQRPYFAGSAASAGMIIALGAKGEDAPPLQLAAYRQAVKCERLDCIDFALPRVAEPRLKEDLERRKAALKPVATLATSPARPIEAEAGRIAKPNPGRPAGVPVKTAPHIPAPTAPRGLPDPVAAFIVAHRSTSAGMYEIGRSFLLGQNGFPANWLQAKLWLEAAAPHDANAAYQLGVAFDEGLGPKADKAAARDWFLKAAALGSADGAGHAGSLLEASSKVGGDPRRSFQLYQQGVAGGSTYAMLALGENYLYGVNGQSVNGVEAQRLFSRAASLGDADGYTDLGNCYASGVCGGRKDFVAAAQFFLKAAEAGSVHANSNLAGAYLRGEGVAKNKKAAFDWFMKAAVKGDRIAERHVGDFLSEGFGGVAKNPLAAARWYRKSAEAGDPFAAEALARFYERQGRDVTSKAEAAHWHQEAAALGLQPGMYALSRMLVG